MAKGNGIFCVEGEWSLNPRDQTSVLPLLNFLWDVDGVEFCHRDVVNAAALRMLLERWSRRKFDRLPILYVPSHGERKRLLLGHFARSDCKVSLDEFEAWLERRCRGRLIFLGACELMREKPSRWRRFLDRTRAVAVCGYTREVRWIESAAFEMLVLAAMQADQFTPAGAASIKRRIMRQSGPMARRLGFRMFVR